MRLPLLFPLLFISIFLSAQDSNYPALFLNEDLTHMANAVVRLDRTDIHIFSSKKMTVKSKQVVTVLNRAGDQHARTALGYDSSKNIKHLNVVVYDAAGRQIEKIKKKNFRDVNVVDGFSLYNDYRKLYYNYTPIKYPYTVEFNYEYETSDTGAIPSWYFLGGFFASVEKSFYSITYAEPSLRPIIHEKNLENFKFEKNETNHSISYLANNIPAVKRESMSPSFKRITPRLMTRIKNFHYKGFDGSVDNWAELGSWVGNKLLSGRDELSPETIAKAEALVAGVEDDLEKAKIIYKYVQENTRYVSVQIGIGGLQPIAAIEVDRVKYGDCKGLSNYTGALLKAVGVTAYYAVVEAGNDKVDFEDDFADLAQGNHVILCIPYNDKYYWLDCTSQILPFGYIGSFTDDRKVMVIKPDGGEIVTTTAYVNEDNYQSTIATYELKPDGSISGQTEVVTKGSKYNSHFRLEEETEEEVIRQIKNRWSSINNLTVANYYFENNKKDVVFNENISFSATNYASTSGDRFFFRANAFNNRNIIPDRYRNRKLPFEIQRGYLEEDDSTISLPEGYAVETLPSTKKIENEFGVYTVNFEYNEESNTVNYERRFFLKKGFYPKEKYKAYRDFRKEVASIDNAPIVLLKE
ncbi:Transglutaminase-like superfamily protein [Zobellia uliginosa]|uniref:Transglutaminase-like superfamily protein n=1 Tax=Zobellia uliginosa TaxID=143224 RepID=A0ABY1L1Y2_9FLAO|nr:DUF3857 domain-containing protein [Zobellia uliginosa]SIS93610.1 Transglutaminase-like superfamily protein [Zobellia uliginosa]